MKQLARLSGFIRFFVIVTAVCMSRAFGRVVEPERGLHATGEQISTIPDDYLELRTHDIDLGIESQDLRRILYSLNRGSLRNFPTLSEATIIMDNLASQFGASYIKRYIIGKSYEGRPIEAYRIGFFGKENDTESEDSYPNIKSGDKPAFLLTSMHHSREPAGLTTGIYFVSKLLEDAVYKQDPASYFLLSNIEIWYVPFVNPDGYAAIERTRNFAIRKNQRKTCNSGRPDEDGVDINRNYDYGFDNSLISKCDPQEYSGEYPFSEPETRAIRDLVVNVKNFNTAVNLHTFGDLWTIPWNCCKNKDLSERAANIYNELRYEILISSPSCILRTLFHVKGPFFINSVTKGFSTSFFTKSRNEFENISKYCFSSAARNPIMDYEASGEADDYLLGVHNIISLSPEIGSDYFGFYPPQSEIFPVAKKYYSQILAVASKSTIELSISSALHIQKYDTLGNGRLDLSLFNSGLSTVCSKRNTPPQNANKANDGCHSVLAWELLTSNCDQFSEFDPGNTLFGNYSAGFRYRSSNLRDWSSIVNNTDDCNTRQLLISFNKKNNKEQGREDFQFIKGFTFSGSIEPRSSRGFKLKFRYKNPLNVVPFDLNQNSNFIIHACFAIFKSEYTDNICQCGFIKFPNGNSHSNTALIVQSTSSDHLCGQLHANKNEFLPYSDPVEEYSGRRDIIFLSRESAYTAVNLTYVSVCIIMVTVVTAISILYSIVYKKYYIDSVKTVNNHIAPVVSEALCKA